MLTVVALLSFLYGHLSCWEHWVFFVSLFANLTINILPIIIICFEIGNKKDYINHEAHLQNLA